MVFAASRVSFGRMRNLVQIVYSGLLGSLLALSAVAYMMMDRFPRIEDLSSSALYFAGGLMSALSLGFALILPTLLRTRAEGESVAARLQGYVYTRLIFGACFEGAGLLWTVIALLLSEPACLAGPATCLVFLVHGFPTTSKITAELGLDENQIEDELERMQSRL